MNSVSMFEALETLDARLGEQSLVMLEAYRRARCSIFPSPGSMAGFVRLHGRDLVACGALLTIGEAWHVRVQIFDDHVRAVQSLQTGAGASLGHGRDW